MTVLPSLLNDVEANANGRAPLDMTEDEMKAMIAELSSQNAMLRKGQRLATTLVRMKVSEKGALSVYGLGRFPVTLYQETWLKLLAMSGDIEQFIQDNADSLKVKGQD